MRIKREKPNNQNRKGAYRAAVNPNAETNNTGRGGATGREWKKHKYTTRERNKDGKWVYDRTTGGGNNSQDTAKVGNRNSKEPTYTRKDINEMKTTILVDKAKELFTDIGTMFVPGTYEGGADARRERRDEAFDEFVKDGAEFIDIMTK